MDSQTELGLGVGRWEHFPHGADLGVRGFGATPAEAFVQAARALCAAIVDLATVRCDEAIDIEREAPSLDLLLMDWLNALVYEMAARRIIFAAFEVCLAGGKLTGRAFGEKISRERHAPAVEVKGATFTELTIREDRPGLWRAQCVVDV
jgi:SHS2 domain-containing protein